MQTRRKFQKPHRVGMRRVPEQYPGRTTLHDGARVHDTDGIGKPCGHRQGMGDEHDGEAAGGHQFPEQIEDLGLDGHIEGRGRLVSQGRTSGSQERAIRSGHADASHR